MTESSVRRQEIAAEQVFVDQAYERLEAAREGARAVYEDGMARGRYRHRAGLVERDAMTFHAAKRLQELDSEYEGLVFGRLDLASGTIRRIGRIGLRDASLSAMLVDWRAPAAAPFYQATAEDPMDVVRRRVIRCSGPTVTNVDDELLVPTVPDGLQVVGEGALMAALSQARSTAMRDIVATIQREQDQAIRAPSRGITQITGGPGTGKTAVALHRAAYLLYQERQRYGGAGVLIVGPSAVFVSYISHVLPSLGEDSVELRTVGELLDGVSADRRDRPDVAAIKGSTRMRKVLHRLARLAPPDAPTELGVVYSGDVLRLDAAELARVRRIALAPGQPPNSTRIHAADALVEALLPQAARYAGEGRRPNRAELYGALLDRPEYRRFLLEWWPFPRPATVLSWLADPSMAGQAARGILTAAEIASLSASYAHLAADGPTQAGGGGSVWSVADVALLDELRELLGTPPEVKRRPRPPHPEDPRELTTWADRAARPEYERPPNYDDYALVVVDEAQDLSPMQWRMIGRRGRHADWTIVGDPAQSSWPDPAEAAQAQADALGRSHRRYSFHLPINYRNPAEIFTLAMRAAGPSGDGAVVPRAVRVTGVDPVLLTVTTAELPAQVRHAAAELVRTVEGTVCVIAAMAAAGAVRDWLAALGDQVMVLGSLDTKGLEFDGVVVVEPAQLLAEATTGRHGLYVALSRATHRLTVIDTDPSWRPTPDPFTP